MKQTKLESLQKVSFKLIYDCSHNKNRFEGSNNKKIELIMLSSTSFDKLEPLQKAKVNETSQDYEQVDGFESLRKICTIHIIYGMYIIYNMTFNIANYMIIYDKYGTSNKNNRFFL